MARDLSKYNYIYVYIYIPIYVSFRNVASISVYIWFEQQDRVGVVSQVGLLRGQSSKPGRRRFSYVQTFPDRLWGQHSLHLNGYHIFFLALRRPKIDTGQSLLSSAEVETKWTYTAHLSTLSASITCAGQLYLTFNE